MKNLILTALIILSLSALSLHAKEKRVFTNTFPLQDCTFQPEGNNPYFKLQTGRVSYFNNLNCFNEGECDEFSELTITVTNDVEVITLQINGNPTNIIARVVEEYETTDGELEEISRNFFAECSQTQDIYYFGEDVDIYEDGEIISHEGAWRAGINDAKPGIIFPGGAFILGARYFQEVAPPAALDRAEHTASEFDVSVPAGDFEHCVEVTETTPLDKHEESIKYYCHDVGLVFDDDLELLQVIE